MHRIYFGADLTVIPRHIYLFIFTLLSSLVHSSPHFSSCFFSSPSSAHLSSLSPLTSLSSHFSLLLSSSLQFLFSPFPLLSSPILTSLLYNSYPFSPLLSSPLLFSPLPLSFTEILLPSPLLSSLILSSRLLSAPFLSSSLLDSISRPISSNDLWLTGTNPVN